MVTRDDPFICPPRISEGAFAAALAGSPALDESGADVYYALAVKRGIDPAFLAAMFAKESSLGTRGVATLTHAWGNMRNPPVGDVPFHLYQDAAKGQYLSFATWRDGCDATCAHIRWYFDTLGIRSIGALPFKWAPKGDGGNDPAAYGDFLVAYINEHADRIGGVHVTHRIIVSAGHDNIGNIGPEMIGQQSADALRGGTGANGEREWTVACRDALVPLLVAAGFDAVGVDAIYHADVYQPHADLVLALHYDGVGGTGRGQYAMASAVYSGQSDDSADAKAEQFVKAWYALYLPHFGFAPGPITDNMTGYYGGWYRTHDSPMALIEHCLGADGGGIRADRPTPQAAAAEDALVVFSYFGVPAPPRPQPQPETFVPAGSPNGVPIDPMLWPRWHYLDTLALALPQIGYPLAPPVALADGRTAQQFERGWLAGTNPGDVVMLFPSEAPKAA